jgi:hypothetical protein
MQTIYRLVLFVHICAGFLGLIAFWTPALARKGGIAHRKVGMVFYRCTAVVAVSGTLMALVMLATPGRRAGAPFLFYLVLITFTPVYHGVRVLETRDAPETLRTRFHTALHLLTLAASAAMIVLGGWFHQAVFLAMSPIGFLIGLGDLGFARKPYASPMAWWYEHMGSMLGGGIAFHTAFLVIGAGRLLGLQLQGTWAVLPWITPTLIGVPASALWRNYYRRRFEGRRDGLSVTTAPVMENGKW